jgi:hypothetical protein
MEQRPHQTASLQRSTKLCAQPTSTPLTCTRQKEGGEKNLGVSKLSALERQLLKDAQTSSISAEMTDAIKKEE